MVLEPGSASAGGTPTAFVACSTCAAFGTAVVVSSATQRALFEVPPVTNLLRIVTPAAWILLMVGPASTPATNASLSLRTPACAQYASYAVPFASPVSVTSYSCLSEPSTVAAGDACITCTAVGAVVPAATFAQRTLSDVAAKVALSVTAVVLPMLNSVGRVDTAPAVNVSLWLSTFACAQ